MGFARPSPVLVNQIQGIDNFDPTTAYTFTGSTTTDAVANTIPASWTLLYTNVPQDMSSLEFLVTAGGNAGNTNTLGLYEFAYGDATNKEIVIEAFPIGGAFSEHSRVFPVFIPGGTNLYWRVKSLQTSTVVTIACQLLPMNESFGNNIRPFKGCFSTGYTINTTLAAASVPGALNNWGTHTAIGSTTKDVYAFKLVPFLSVGLVNPAGTWWARALINTTIEIDRIRFNTSTSEWIDTAHNLLPISGYIPNGTSIGCQTWTDVSGSQSPMCSLLCFYK